MILFTFFGENVIVNIIDMSVNPNVERWRNMYEEGERMVLSSSNNKCIYEKIRPLYDESRFNMILGILKYVYTHNEECKKIIGCYVDLLYGADRSFYDYVRNYLDS